jgi:hypothetical protein
MKDQINQLQVPAEKQELQSRYWKTNRQVKRSARDYKRIYIEELTEEVENACSRSTKHEESV